MEYKNQEEVRQILSWYADKDMAVAEFWVNIDNLISKIKESVPLSCVVSLPKPEIEREILEHAFSAGFGVGQLIDKTPLNERQPIIKKWFDKWIEARSN
jgi:hypothetical protein